MKTIPVQQKYSSIIATSRVIVNLKQGLYILSLQAQQSQQKNLNLRHTKNLSQLKENLKKS